MAGRPLKPANDRRLGGPLPHQLANRTQAPPQAPEGFNDTAQAAPSHAVLTPISQSCPPLRDRLLTRYSPVCHWSLADPVRLACIKHTASVYPEPGSNSLNQSLFNFAVGRTFLPLSNC